MFKEKKEVYLPHIDGLRAIAVLSVLFFHLGFTFLPGGYIGVDIFFVISGFLITGILKSELDKNNTLNFVTFFSRRIKRLLPALVIVSMVTFSFASIVFSPGHLQRIGGALSSALLNSSNIFFWLEADYFDTSAKFKPFLHTWSLSIEWQFYLILPVIMFSLYKLSLRKLLLPLLFLAGAISLYLNFRFANGNETRLNIYFPSLSESLNNGKSTIFYLVFFRIFEFMIGAFLLWMKPLKPAYDFLYDVFLWIGLSIILYSVVIFNEQMLFPYWHALLPCIGTALVIYSGHKAKTNNIIINKFLIWIGILSYSLYLVHWPIIVFWHYLGDDLGLAQQLIIIILSFTLAILLNKFIEQPFRSRHISFQNIFWIGFGFVILLTAGIHSYYNQGWQWRVGKNEPIVKFELMKAPKEYHKKYYGGSGYPYNKGIKTESDTSIIILGDSHGRHYAEGIYKLIAKPNNYSFYVAGASCLILPDFTRVTKGANWDKICSEAFSKSLQYIQSAKQPPLVVISHSWLSQIGRSDMLDINGNRMNLKVTTEMVLDGLSNLKEKIGNAKLLVIGLVPGSSSNLYDIFTRPNPIIFDNFEPSSYYFRERKPALSNNKNSLDKKEKFNRVLLEYANRTKHFTFINPFEYLCDQDKCRNLDNNRYFIYSDGGHLSKHGSIFLIRSLKAQIMETIKQKN